MEWEVELLEKSMERSRFHNCDYIDDLRSTLNVWRTGSIQSGALIQAIATIEIGFEALKLAVGSYVSAQFDAEDHPVAIVDLVHGLHDSHHSDAPILRNVQSMLHGALELGSQVKLACNSD